MDFDDRVLFVVQVKTKINIYFDPPTIDLSSFSLSYKNLQKCLDWRYPYQQLTQKKDVNPSRTTQTIASLVNSVLHKLRLLI